MEKVLAEIQKINSRLELIEQRLANLEVNSKATNRTSRDRKRDIKESPIGMKIVRHSNLGAQDETQPCSSRDVMEGDIAFNERGPLPGMFMQKSF